MKIQIGKGNGNRQVSNDPKTVQIQIGREVMWVLLGVVVGLLVIWGIQ
jgi:hypothetical protein